MCAKSIFETVVHFRSENPGVPVLFGGYNVPLLVEIELTDLPKSGNVAPPAPPGTTLLHLDTHKYM